MKTVMMFLVITCLFIGLVACSPVAPGVQPACTSCPTYEPLPTYTLYPTYTPYPTLKPYSTYTPYPTPTEIPPTRTPETTSTPEPTVNPELTTDKTDGIWLVGSEVAAGLWRASGDCWAVTRDKAGDQLDMASGSRAIITVPPSAFAVEFANFPDTCTWSYLGR